MRFTGELLGHGLLGQARPTGGLADHSAVLLAFRQ